MQCDGRGRGRSCTRNLCHENMGVAGTGCAAARFWYVWYICSLKWFWYCFLWMDRAIRWLLRALQQYATLRAIIYAESISHTNQQCWADAWLGWPVMCSHGYISDMHHVCVCDRVGEKIYYISRSRNGDVTGYPIWYGMKIVIFIWIECNIFPIKLKLHKILDIFCWRWISF